MLGVMFAYSPDALIYDSGSNTWSLRPDYDPALHRVEIVISDDDPFLDGDWDADEVGDDTNQTAQVFDTSGNPVASGQVYSEVFYTLERPDLTQSWVDRVEIGGQLVGYIVSAPLVPGESYTQLSVTNVGSPAQTGGAEDRLEYSQAASVPCFGPGVRIQTDMGPVPIERIAAGDRVLTRDNGYQPVLDISRSRFAGARVASERALQPVIIPRAAFGAGQPAQDVVLSRQHRVLIVSPAVALHFGVDEALAPAHAVAPPGANSLPWRGDITYHHLLFARHEIVLANGLWAESLLPGEVARSAMSPEARERLGAVLDGGMDGIEAARLCLKAFEARLVAPSFGCPGPVTGFAPEHAPQAVAQ